MACASCKSGETRGGKEPFFELPQARLGENLKIQDVLYKWLGGIETALVLSSCRSTRRSGHPVLGPTARGRTVHLARVLRTRFLAITIKHHLARASFPVPVRLRSGALQRTTFGVVAPHAMRTVFIFLRRALCDHGPLHTCCHRPRCCCAWPVCKCLTFTGNGCSSGLSSPHPPVSTTQLQGQEIFGCSGSGPCPSNLNVLGTGSQTMVLVRGCEAGVEVEKSIAT
ncbi:hypothetical protein B0H14DRAFT_3531569 [Mycena olivaceomarginata]|nr:hypothetical protein B0H14DRAFT_3531569 [Mycena olivaceomarginata]